jgi:hypothetical protein
LIRFFGFGFPRDAFFPSDPHLSLRFRFRLGGMEGISTISISQPSDIVVTDENRNRVARLVQETIDSREVWICDQPGPKGDNGSIAVQHEFLDLDFFPHQNVRDLIGTKQIEAVLLQGPRGEPGRPGCKTYRYPDQDRSRWIDGFLRSIIYHHRMKERSFQAHARTFLMCHLLGVSPLVDLILLYTERFVTNTATATLGPPGEDAIPCTDCVL